MLLIIQIVNDLYPGPRGGEHGNEGEPFATLLTLLGESASTPSWESVR